MEALGNPGVWEVASGLDALYMSGRVEIPEAVIERLQIAREIADEAESPVDLEFGVSYRVAFQGLAIVIIIILFLVNRHG